MKKELTQKEKREKAYNWGLPILGGIIMGTFITILTNVWWHFFVGYILGAYAYKSIKKEMTIEGCRK